jgi:hypothetical protein
MRYPKEFSDKWTPTKKHETDEEIEAQVVETIEELYGQTAVNEYEVEEFCRLDRFREFMLKAFVPSKH